MNSKTRDLLISAHRENRLAAVHIDFQVDYYHSQTFRAAADFTAELRDLHVPNIWVGLIQQNTSRITDVKGMNEECRFRKELMHSLLGALPDETAIIKTKVSAFDDDNAPLHEYLAQEQKNTLLIDGVTADSCVSETLIDAVESERYDIIAVTDVIDLRNVDLYHDRLLKRSNNHAAFARHFHMACAKDVISTLACTALKNPQYGMPAP